MSITSKITIKGQVTIPKHIRKTLNSNVVEFEVRKGIVLMKPVINVGGSLNKYSKQKKSIYNIREKVWTEVVHKRQKS